MSTLLSIALFRDEEQVTEWQKYAGENADNYFPEHVTFDTAQVRHDMTDQIVHMVGDKERAVVELAPGDSLRIGSQRPAGDPGND